jgi:ectoine hydroxylase-related dioxygenase (phytanoyl-CoA dioxygenase family)
MQINEDQKRIFRKDGFLVLKNCIEIQNLLREIKIEICNIGNNFMNRFDFETSAEKINSLSSTQRKALYTSLRYMPSLTQLACSKILIDISKQLDLAQPAVMHSYNLRMDMPNEPQYMFHWHQDITYLLGSKNSITYWIPLTKVNEYHGSIELIAKSHEKGVYPFYYTGNGLPPSDKPMSPKDIKLIKEPTECTKLIEADVGDIIVFSQFLLHRTTPNNSELTRWTAQIRHSDFSEVEFQEAGFPMGDITNIFQNDYLKF